MRIAILCSLLLLLTGCGGPPAPASPWVPIAEVPVDLATVAQKKLPNVKFDTARKIKVKGEDAFEIRGKAPNGKIREVEVSVGGEVLEVE